MTRFLRPLLLTLVLAAASATPALADVHRISEADCAPTGVPSGASSEGSQAAPGRPNGQIPVSAGGLESNSEGAPDDAGSGKHCRSI